LNVKRSHGSKTGLLRGIDEVKLSTRLFGKSYRFKSVKDVLARANEARSGDELAGIGAKSEQERVAAKMVLADLMLRDLRENPVVPYEGDEVTRVIDDALDRDSYGEIANKTVGEFREWLLNDRRQSSRSHQGTHHCRFARATLD
jgi:ethanolamine ammonia-lyase large subunit